MASLAAFLDALTQASSITSIVAVEGTCSVSHTETCTGVTSLPLEGLFVEVSLGASSGWFQGTSVGTHPNLEHDLTGT